MHLFHKKEEDNILKLIYKEGRLKRASLFILGIIISALAFNCFLKPMQIVYGVGGLALIINKYTEWDISTIMLIASLLLLVLSFMFMGRQKTSKTIAGSILYPIMVKATEFVVPYVDIKGVDTILVVALGAVVTGFGLGLIFKSGYTTGGTDILNQIVAKYFKMSMGNAMFFTDGIIILAALFVFGIPKFLYSVVNICLISYMTDKVILGISQSKTFFIITDHETAVKKFLLDDLNHGVTVIDSRGGYTGDFNKMIMCTVPTKEYFLLKEGLFKIDPDAFYIVTDAYEVSKKVIDKKIG